ncbi:hypothetical protein K1X13_18605 [Nocardioides sp. WL0053]|uniref:SRPBCC family protein n=1 Tax=Nocardioides jiangsuensis TaxID=2866161 RepID=A0ABS7RP55_9ACTN|nr:hypothetical protein [Nocardioides jiangsuensis]MBY9076846.1 hypothetical protein [Nocardioides jiangsuensis]
MPSTRMLTRPLALAVAAGAAYGVSRWPAMTHWGATPDETEESLPGDEIVGEARYRTTHAVTIDAPVERVWPWLVQLGQGRGGMYSYDWLENLVGLHMHSADRIHPELQDLAVGDVVRLVPAGTDPPLRFVVARLEAPHVLVLGPSGSRADALAGNLPYPCWTFRLRPTSWGGTRLVVRFQSDFRPSPAGWLMNKYALTPVHFAMERKMLLGIKERAEQDA